MTKYEVHYSRYFSERFPDVWTYSYINANSEKEATDKLQAEFKVNYILHCHEAE